MRRRDFISLLGGAAVLGPLAARAQQTAIPVIGFLSSLSAPVTTKRISSFGQGLSELGYTVGRDATVEAHPSGLVKLRSTHPEQIGSGLAPDSGHLSAATRHH
jgi:hypothetical protein